MALRKLASSAFSLAGRSAAAPAWRASSFTLYRSYGTGAAEEQDLVIIGGGPGGYVAAIKAGQLGMKVTCVEKRGSLGGTCLNVGCIPSKSLLHTSQMYEDANKTFSRHGINCEGVSFDLSKVMDHKQKTVKSLTGGIEHLFKKNKVTYEKGFGKLLSNNEVEVTLNDNTTKVIKTKNVMLATGSEPIELPFLPFDEKTVVSSTGALALDKVPENLIVIGGGVIGLELGSVWRRFGSNVTVVEFGDKICPFLDKDVGTAFTKSLKKQGMNFMFGTKVIGGTNNGDSVSLQVEPVAGGEAKTLNADAVLVSIGRRPFTDNLNLEGVGVKTDDRNRIVVDEKFRTSVPNVYSIGDCVAGPMLAHKAEEEGIACVEDIAGGHGHINYATIPGVIYTHPEVAWVGMNSDEATKAGYTIKTGSFPFMANSRAKANDDIDGIVKFVTEAETDKILGAQIVGAQAGEQIHEAVLAMEYSASCEDIGRTCHAHPTLSEAIKEAAMAAYDKPIHF
mmetsp:Transcript_18839/g.47864  ORF Transcript_18839/g.47864 Transcript_18839/m.47864 type:complete len:506 (+) Transcript_18839:78-1595(+)